MYYDFQLNKNGDILFKQSDHNKNYLQFDFYVASSNGLRFDFYVDNYINSQQYLSGLQPSFAFDFYIDVPKNNKEILCIDDKEDYIYQQIKIRLNSAIGSIENNEKIGSDLDKYRHILLNPDKENDYSALINSVKEAIKDILPNAEVNVYNRPSIYTDFTNSIIVYIVQNDINYYYYL